MKTAWLLTSLLTLSSGVALAAETPWAGTWKLDPDKSQLTGQTITFAQGSGGLLHYEDGSTANYDFGLDGKDYRSWGNHTTAWTAAGKNTWDTVRRADGKVLSKEHWILSDDAQTLTATFTGTRPDGKTFREEDVFRRTSGSDGLIGTWQTAKITGPTGPQTFVISSPMEGVLHYEIPDMKATVELRPDGADHSVSGPTIPPGMTIAYKSLTPTKMKYTIKIGGKPDMVGIQTIAADKTSFADVSWNPGRESEKTTAVYVKQ
jgi:hypothetical protein